MVAKSDQPPTGWLKAYQNHGDTPPFHLVISQLSPGLWDKQAHVRPLRRSPATTAAEAMDGTMGRAELQHT